MRDHRRLAAIVSVDVAGYARLMGQDDSGTLTRLKAHRGELIDAKVAEHDGRIVKSTGDGLLLEFPSVVDAVRCAVEIQHGMANRNAGLLADQRIDFRIGINVGDIIIDDGDIFGDGVNIAARIEALAEPGGICISGKVYEEVANKLAYAFEDTGLHQVKNITHPIRVYALAHNRTKPIDVAKVVPSTANARAPATLLRARRQRWVWTTLLAASLLAALSYAWREKLLSVLSNPTETSIAVLPFVDMSEKHDQEYFSDGLSEEVIDQLTHADGLKVIARTSSFQFKGKSEDMRVIAQKLGVTHVLEGSVRRSGDELRVTAQLIRAKDGTHQWSQTYSRDVRSIFKVQDEIARTVAQALSVELRTGPSTDEGRPSSVVAYNLFLEGNYFATHNNKADLAKAIGLYKQAIELEPDYAMAWVRLADAHSVLGETFGSNRDVIEARAAIERALQIDARLAAAHVVRGNLLRSFDWDWQAAATEYLRAKELSLDPHRYDVALAAIGLLFGRIDESIAAKQLALERNPLSAGARASLGMDLYYAGRYNEAASVLRKVSELVPSYSLAKSLLATTLIFQGRNREALDAVQQEPDDAWRASVLPVAYWSLGKRVESNQAMTRLVTNFSSQAAFQIAEAYAYRGEIDLSLEWLEKAYSQRDSGLQWTKVDPLLSNLRNEPRYRAFVVKMKLDGDGKFSR